jgi:hypothetical protein
VPTNLAYGVLGAVVLKVCDVLARHIDVRAVRLLTSAAISVSVAENGDDKERVITKKKLASGRRKW